MSIDQPEQARYAAGVPTFGENLKAERERRRISQVQLAELLGVLQGQISAWERGDRQPNADSIRRIADALSTVEPCPPAVLLAGVVTEIDELRGAVIPTPAREPTPLTKREKTVLRLFGLMSDPGQRRALGLLAELAKAFPRERPPGSGPRSGRTHEGRARKEQ